MAYVTERELFSQDGKKKVELFRRENGTYGFRVLYWSDEPMELCWCQVGGYAESITDSLAAMEAEARGRIEWLVEKQSDA
jgi:hypothetical protein